MGNPQNKNLYFNEISSSPLPQDSQKYSNMRSSHSVGVLGGRLSYLECIILILPQRLALLKPTNVSP